MLRARLVCRAAWSAWRLSCRRGAASGQACLIRPRSISIAVLPDEKDMDSDQGCGCQVMVLTAERQPAGETRTALAAADTAAEAAPTAHGYPGEGVCRSAAAPARGMSVPKYHDHCQHK